MAGQLPFVLLLQLSHQLRRVGNDLIVFLFEEKAVFPQAAAGGRHFVGPGATEPQLRQLGHGARLTFLDQQIPQFFQVNGGLQGFPLIAGLLQAFQQSLAVQAA